MENITVLADGYQGIQEYMASVDRPYDLSKSYLQAYKALAVFYISTGQETYDPAMNAKYREHIDRQVECGSFSERRKRLHRRLTFMLDDYYAGRPIQAIYSSGKRYKYKLDVSSELLVEEFTNSLDLSAVAIPCACTIARSFFYYLQQNGLADSKTITEEAIVGFLKFKSMENSSSMDSVLYFLRKILLFLKDSQFEVVGLDIASYKASSIRRRTLPAFESSEIEAILSFPDRSTAMGKRDYAIFLLASFTGIRAIGIANLIFEDIRRADGSIAFVQHKTGHMNALPVSQEAIHAIDDYIENGRPESPLPYVFLTALRPYRKLSDVSSVRSIFNRYASSCGLCREAWDGKSFHAFRRTAAKWLLESSADTQMISQVLGQRDREVLKRYLPLAPGYPAGMLARLHLRAAGSEVYR